jgi:hypothetical protein
MKKAILALPLAVFLTACGTTDVYEKRANEARERQERLVERSLKKAPKWMTELPKSSNAVYANGSAVSGDLSMADEKAKVVALGKICIAAGGEVDQRSQVFRSDTSDSSNENSEMAIRSLCRKVDVTGAEVVEIKRVPEGHRYRTYILMALPVGEANQLRRERVNEAAAVSSVRRSQEVFKELDSITEKPVR